MVSVKQEMQRAQQLIRQKRYEDARAILITVNHPTADKWLARLNTARPTPLRRNATPQSFTGKLAVTLLLFLLGYIPGLIALAIFAPEAKRAQANTNQPIPGAQALITLNRFIFFISVGILAILALVSIVLLAGNPYGW